MKAKIKYYNPQGFWLGETQLITKFERVSHLRQSLEKRREAGDLPKLPNQTQVIIWFEVEEDNDGVSGVIPIESSAGVTFGDRAQGNVTITGGIGGDVIGGDLIEGRDRDIIIRKRK